MAVNFLDTSALMVGVDAHTFWPAVPPGAKVPTWPHLVGMKFSGPSKFWSLTKKSTSQANAMVQDGWSLVAVPHVPYPVPPGPKELMEYLMLIVTSQSEPVLAIGSVTGEGTALAVCVYGCVGLNLNCGPFESDMITGVVICVNSVQTTPTLSDIVGAAIKLLAASILAPLVGFLAGKGAGPVNKIVKKLTKPLLKVLKRRIVKTLRNIPKPLIEFLARFLTKQLAEKVTPAVKGKVTEGTDPVAQGVLNAMGI